MNKQEKIIAGILAAVLLILMYYNSLQQVPGKQVPDRQKPAHTQPTESGEKEAKDKVTHSGKEASSSKAEQPAPEKPETGKSPKGEAGKLLPQFKDLPDVATQKLIVHSAKGDKLAEYEIDPRLGGIVNVRLFKYLRDHESNSPYEWGTAQFPMTAIRKQNEDSPEKSFSKPRIVEAKSNLLVVERQMLGQSLILRQEWETQPGSYQLQYRVSITNVGTRYQTLPDLIVNAGVAPPLNPARGLFNASGIDQMVQYFDVEDDDTDYYILSKLKGLSAEKREALGKLKIRWVAVQNKFFATSLVSLIPPTPLSGLSPLVLPFPKRDAAKKKALAYVAATVALRLEKSLSPGKSLSRTYGFYVGPKKYDQLKALGFHQNAIMGFDRFLFGTVTFMEWVAWSIYSLLKIFYSLFHNYGVAILLSTIVIRSILFPLTFKSTLLSQKMKEIKPEIDKLKERYGNDPQKLNVEIMNLYREKGVNPFGGCLPLLFQIPVFFALFNVLRSAIELRLASFLWVNDLSLPDHLFTMPTFLPFIGGMPFNLLPIIMGVSMFFQQRLMPTSPDPAQQKIMDFMTIFIIFVCYNMPAGLTLYWAANNIISIIQFRIVQPWLLERKEQKKGT
ncbi:MAG: membrane protein insertase YidC [Lentisphaerae bacterium]|nr:MAG: membrane protein insertase YidC [Lentisphaerota bacterium]